MPASLQSWAKPARPILTGLPGSRSVSLRVSCGAVVLACLLAACGSSTPVAPQRTHSNLISIIEAEGFLHANPLQALRTFRSLGVDEVRVYLTWSSFAPDPTSPTAPVFNAADPAAYPASDWGALDKIVRSAATVGIGLDFTVGGPAPAWAVGPTAPHGSPYDGGWMPSSRRFGQFVHALGVRYSGHYLPSGASSRLPSVNFWAIWNEPNYGHYLSPQAVGSVEVSPRVYRGLLDAAWSALLATGHRPPRDTILIGETAPRGLVGPGLPGDFSGMVPLRFIRALYCVDSSLQPLRGRAAAVRGCPVTAAADHRFVRANPGLFQASGFADHPYPDAFAPDIRTPLEPDYADFAALGNLERTLTRAAAAFGQTVRLPIYSTEFGYRTNPPTSLGVPLRAAALYLNQSEYLSWRDPRVRSYDQYLLTDPPAAARTDFDTGLEFADGRPKPSVYAAFRMPLYLPVTRARRGQVLQVWGGVRPAPVTAARTGHRPRVLIQWRSGAGSRYRTLRTLPISDPHGYFDTFIRFPGSGEVRLQWSGSGRALHSRTQSIRLS